MGVETSEKRPPRLRREEQARWRQWYLAQLPWWRKPLVGYLLTVPFTALAMLLSWLLFMMGVPGSFLAVPAFLMMVLIAWLWGTGPAIVAIVLGILALDYFFLHQGESTPFELGETLPLFPFLLAQLVVAMITSQREAARQQALFAQHELEVRARELEEANQALEQANQIKDQFLSMASHELRTPLTIMRTQVQFDLRRLAKQQELPPEIVPLRETLKQVDEHTHQLQGLVDVFLGLSVLREERMPLRLASCDMNALCRKVLEEQQALSGRSIVLQAPSTPIILKADGERIRQVVTNLVTNAIKYSPQASMVLISLSQSDTGATLQVHNDGKPISIQQQKRIFELYYRTPNAWSSQEEGWGLGLAICKEIVKRHQGRIWVESSNERGTTFFVWLPLNVSLS